MSSHTTLSIVKVSVANKCPGSLESTMDDALIQHWCDGIESAGARWRNEFGRRETTNHTHAPRDTSIHWRNHATRWPSDEPRPGRTSFLASWSKQTDSSSAPGSPQCPLQPASQGARRALALFNNGHQGDKWEETFDCSKTSWKMSPIIIMMMIQQ